MKLEIILDDGALMPHRAHADDAGLDILTPIGFCIERGAMVVIDSGVHVNIPKGYAGLLKSKSGLMINKGIITVGGVIDAGYTGSIRVALQNISSYHQFIPKGQKITQLLIMPVETPDLEVVESFPKTERGDKGFGSTDEKLS